MNKKFTARFEELSKELKRLGAGDFKHLNGSLISHLQNTREILVHWGASAELCDAGLFHAAYGSAGFSKSMLGLSQREKIASLIGHETEKLVYLYCSCERAYVFPKLGTSKHIEFKDRFVGSTFTLSNAQAKLFCELTVANELELVYASKAFKVEHGEGLFGLFESMQGYLSTAAIQAYKLELSPKNN